MFRLECSCADLPLRHQETAPSSEPAEATTSTTSTESPSPTARRRITNGAAAATMPWSAGSFRRRCAAAFTSSFSVTAPATADAALYLPLLSSLPPSQISVAAGQVLSSARPSARHTLAAPAAAASVTDFVVVRVRPSSSSVVLLRRRRRLLFSSFLPSFSSDPPLSLLQLLARTQRRPTASTSVSRCSLDGGGLRIRGEALQGRCRRRRRRHPSPVSPPHLTSPHSHPRCAVFHIHVR